MGQRLNNLTGKIRELKNGGRKLESELWGAKDKLSSELENIIGTVETTAFSLTNGGGFVGMDVDNADTFFDAFNKYIDSIQTIINKFNTEGNISVALKGTELEGAVKEFIEAIKVVLKAYVYSLTQEEIELLEAFGKYAGYDDGYTSVEGESVQAQLTRQTSEKAEKIRDAAKSITLD